MRPPFGKSGTMRPAFGQSHASGWPFGKRETKRPAFSNSDANRGPFRKREAKGPAFGMSPLAKRLAEYLTSAMVFSKNARLLKTPQKI